MIPFIDLKKQYSRIEKDVDQAIKKVLMHGQYILGPEVAELEKKLADFAGTEYCLGCSSGTDALLMAMMALDFKKGDAVFTTPFTFFATVEMIALTGATPVFADIDPKTYNIDPARLREAILKVREEGKLNLKAIVTVDIFGQPADYDEIQKIADEFGMPVIEDGAQAIGASQNGVKVGGFGNCAGLSFFPSKNLGGLGDGGMVITNDDKLAVKIREIRNHGMEPKYYHKHVGGNFRLDAIQAAGLLAKLPHLDDWGRMRAENAAVYNAAFADVDEIKTLSVSSLNRIFIMQINVRLNIWSFLSLSL